MIKWRAELESCGAANYASGSWTLPVPEFFRETRIIHFTLVKPSTLLEHGEEYKEERNTYSRACARDNGPLGNKKLRAKAHAVKRRLQRLHWDNCKVRFDEAVVFSFAVSALAVGFLESDIVSVYDRAFAFAGALISPGASLRRPASPLVLSDDNGSGDQDDNEGLQAAEQLEASHPATIEQSKLDVERVRYQVQRAERRYRAVDPENRLVARGLEAEWEEALRELKAAEAQLQGDEQTRPRVPTPDSMGRAET